MVKQQVRLWSVVLLTAIYCMAVGISTRTIAHANVPMSATSEQAAFVANDLPALLSHAPKAEQTTNTFSSFPTPSFEKSIDHYWAFGHVAERIFHAVFVQYSRFYVTLLIQHRKADLLFPFHYFW